MSINLNGTVNETVTCILIDLIFKMYNVSALKRSLWAILNNYLNTFVKNNFRLKYLGYYICN